MARHASYLSLLAGVPSRSGGHRALDVRGFGDPGQLRTGAGAVLLSWFRGPSRRRACLMPTVQVVLTLDRRGRSEGEEPRVSSHESALRRGESGSAHGLRGVRIRSRREDGAQCVFVFLLRSTLKTKKQLRTEICRAAPQVPASRGETGPSPGNTCHCVHCPSGGPDAPPPRPRHAPRPRPGPDERTSEYVMDVRLEIDRRLDRSVPESYCQPSSYMRFPGPAGSGRLEAPTALYSP